MRIPFRDPFLVFIHQIEFAFALKQKEAEKRARRSEMAQLLYEPRRERVSEVRGVGNSWKIFGSVSMT
jgi:hypothetical protein